MLNIKQCLLSTFQTKIFYNTFCVIVVLCVKFIQIVYKLTLFILFSDSLPPSLLVANFSFNAIMQIDNLAFGNNEKLQVLNMSDSLKFSDSMFSYGIFKSLTNLRHLDLSNSYCRNIPANAFSFLKKLHTLNLKNTYLKTLPLFKTNKNQYVSSLKNISFGTKNQTYSPVKWNNPVLKVLILSNNRRLMLKKIWSESLFPSSLTTLELSGVQFQTINSKVFSNLKKLEILRMNRCYITSIKSKALSGIDSLMEFSAFTNGLRKVPDLPENLMLLNLSNHRIKILTNNSIKHGISNLSKLTSIDLSKGTIKEIYDSTFSEMPMLQSLNLSTNHIYSITETTFKTK